MGGAVLTDLSEKRIRSFYQKLSKAELMTEEHTRHSNSPETFLDTKTGLPYTPHRLYYLHRKVLNEARLPVIEFRQLQLSARRLGL